MLSIAIKNSVILALVILIAHFLLKNSAEERSERPLNFATPVSVPSDTGSGRVGTERRREPTSSVIGMQKEDLYSYVYGEGQEPGRGATPSSPPRHPSSAAALLSTTRSGLGIPKPPPASLGMQESIGGILVGYEGNAGEQWADVS